MQGRHRALFAQPRLVRVASAMAGPAAAAESRDRSLPFRSVRILGSCRRRYPRRWDSGRFVWVSAGPRLSPSFGPDESLGLAAGAGFPLPSWVCGVEVPFGLPVGCALAAAMKQASITAQKGDLKAALA